MTPEQKNKRVAEILGYEITYYESSKYCTLMVRDPKKPNQRHFAFEPCGNIEAAMGLAPEWPWTYERCGNYAKALLVKEDKVFIGKSNTLSDAIVNAFLRANGVEV